MVFILRQPTILPHLFVQLSFVLDVIFLLLGRCVVSWGIEGCSKCLLTEKFGEKPDYSNFYRKEWVPRTDEHHRQEAMKSYHSGEQIGIEKTSGVRYSYLLELPYFNAPRMCVIDPMHNLVLGTSKMMVELWKFSNILTSVNFEAIQSKVVCPSEVASKISSSFRAEQWKNWTIYLSPML